MKNQTFERFPWWVVAIAVGHAVAIYALGVYIIAGFGAFPVILYLLFCAFVELSLLRGGCVNCYYYGKVCGLGRGWLCSLFFKRGDPVRFAQRELAWRDLVPDMLVSVIPLLGGIARLVQRFTWGVLLAMLAIVALASAGNAFVRGCLTCRHCAQRERGCPAEKLFGTKRATRRMETEQ